VQQTTHIPQPGPSFPQATLTYSTPVIHTTQQDHEPIYHSKGVAAYERINELKEKFDKVQLELKALRGKKLFDKNAHDLCLIPNVVIPHNSRSLTLRNTKGTLALRLIWRCT